MQIRRAGSWPVRDHERSVDPERSVRERREDPPAGSGIEQGLPRCRRIEVRPTVARVRMVKEPTSSTSSAAGSATFVRGVALTAVVEVESLHKSYRQRRGGKVRALDGLELSVRAGRGLRVPRSQRVREDHDDPLPPRSGSPDLRPVPGAGRGLARPPARRRREARRAGGGARSQPGPLGPPGAHRPRHDGRTRPSRRRRQPRAGGPRRAGGRSRARLLARHAAAARDRDRPPEGP